MTLVMIRIVLLMMKTRIISINKKNKTNVHKVAADFDDEMKKIKI